ncbi:hypothetical protein AB2B41_15510 [Marimonas sp. MJW-29]|uniref:Uncharacterized protein n=1 Tax=Sulfitobacter sediminis TaxID=3234186 RepID=A0ABV3RPX7_9RHOB
MTGINYSRVLLGGIVAGLLLAGGEAVLGSFVLSSDWEGTSIDPQAVTHGTWHSLGVISVVFLNGFVLTWLYASMRPRFGPGPKTAILSGLTLWLIAWALMGISLTLSGVVTSRIAIVSAIWGVFEVPLAALAGAWFYRENNQTGAQALNA